MKEALGKIIEQTTLVFLILGVALFIYGVSGEITISGYGIKPQGDIERIAVIVLGLCFIGVSSFLILRESLRPGKKDIPSEQSSRFMLPDDVFGPHPNVSRLLTQAKDIYILGYSFDSFLGKFNDSLTKAVINGACVNIMIINPDRQAIKVIEAEVLKSKLESGTITLEEAKSKPIQKAKRIFGSREDIQSALSHARSVARRSKGAGTGSIEVRLIDWIPSCSMIFLNPKQKDGQLILGIYTPYYNLATENRPHVLLTPQKDQHWYESYLSQFNKLWEESKKDRYDLMA